MSDELKSAWELALEKIEKQEGKLRELSDEVKQAIADVRKKYQARIAEVEIQEQSRLKKAIESGNYEEIEKIREQTAAEKRRLNEQMEKEIEKIRSQASD